MDERHADLLSDIVNEKALSDDLVERLRNAIEDYNKDFAAQEEDAAAAGATA
jgi:hypothetical protein